MLVSAISQERNYGCNLNGNMTFYNSRSNETIGDTSFNSLTPHAHKKKISAEKLPQIFDKINEWQNFCNKQVVSGKLDTLA